MIVPFKSVPANPPAFPLYTLYVPSCWFSLHSPSLALTARPPAAAPVTLESYTYVRKASRASSAPSPSSCSSTFVPPEETSATADTSPSPMKPPAYSPAVTVLTPVTEAPAFASLISPIIPPWIIPTYPPAAFAYLYSLPSLCIPPTVKPELPRPVTSEYVTRERVALRTLARSLGVVMTFSSNFSSSPSSELLSTVSRLPGMINPAKPPAYCFPSTVFRL